MASTIVIEFRDGVSGRRAALRDGPDVWEVAMVARAYPQNRDQNRDDLHAHFDGRLSRLALDDALAYAARFPEEIDGWIAENERVERLLDAATRR